MYVLGGDVCLGAPAERHRLGAGGRRPLAVGAACFLRIDAVSLLLPHLIGEVARLGEADVTCLTQARLMGTRGDHEAERPGQNPGFADQQIQPPVPFRVHGHPAPGARAQLRAFFKFKTETAGKGTGLGLSMLFGFTERWGGHINVLHRVGERTTFRLYRRRRAEEIALGPALIALETVEGGSESVLLVEEAARRAARCVLKTDQGAGALEIPASERVDLRFNNIVMPSRSSASICKYRDLALVTAKGAADLGVPPGEEQWSGVRLLSQTLPP